MVYNTDILSLKNAKMCYDILDQLHQKDKMQFVINKYEKGLISPSDFSRMFEKEIFCIIPYESKSASASVNKGIPAVISQPRSSLAAALFGMTSKIISEHSGVEEISPAPHKGASKEKKPVNK